MPSRSSSYLELNFSPSGRWAAYEFAAYRKLVSDAWLPAAPDIEISEGAGRVELTATISLDLPYDPYRLGISAIIEEVGADISYWAVSHAPDKPDFHHPDCFALELPSQQLSPSPRT
jgi:hypothetical protein